ncbi:hypothetical protein [Natranaerofaba carboxydovora]|uniref:hypothetical protein n=1 Tax=Natranaerofaba carboxydovora TaxID=2742683 RepID=UPI001F148670|nr:hypothetical protein [Natranaerofaba carboxydovora]UMZ75015.1 hypothetical protein ACONDI_02623 [Natranaerofaba carboxydovora]
MNKNLLFVLNVTLIALFVGLITAGCGNGEENGEDAKEKEKISNGKEEVEEHIEIKDAGNPLYLNEDDIIVTGVPEDTEEKLEEDFALFRIQMDGTNIASAEELAYGINSYLISFLSVDGDYLFYPEQNDELKILERENLDEVEVLGANRGFHLSGADELVYKLPEGSLDAGDSFRVINLETNDDFILYEGEPDENLIFSYLKENEGIMYREMDDSNVLKHLDWSQVDGDEDNDDADNEDLESDIEDIQTEEITRFDDFAESVVSGYVPAYEEEVIFVAKEASGGTKLVIYNLEGEELYEEEFDGFDGKLYLSPEKDNLAVVLSDKGDYYTYLLDLEEEETTELPPAQDISWCPSGEKLAYYSHLRDVGIYYLEEDDGVLILE